MGFEFDFAMLWEVAGPFIIAALTALIIAIVCLIIMAFIPSRTGKQLFSILAIVLVILGFIGALQIAAKIWGSS